MRSQIEDLERDQKLSQITKPKTMNTITLTLSPTLYQTLQTLANQTGQSPEEIAI